MIANPPYDRFAVFAVTRPIQLKHLVGSFSLVPAG